MHTNTFAYFVICDPVRRNHVFQLSYTKHRSRTFYNLCNMLVPDALLLSPPLALRKTKIFYKHSKQARLIPPGARSPRRSLSDAHIEHSRDLLILKTSPNPLALSLGSHLPPSSFSPMICSRVHLPHGEDTLPPAASNIELIKLEGSGSQACA